MMDLSLVQVSKCYWVEVEVKISENRKSLHFH